MAQQFQFQHQVIYPDPDNPDQGWMKREDHLKVSKALEDDLKLCQRNLHREESLKRELYEDYLMLEKKCRQELRACTHEREEWKRLEREKKILLERYRERLSGAERENDALKEQLAAYIMEEIY